MHHFEPGSGFVEIDIKLYTDAKYVADLQDCFRALSDLGKGVVRVMVSVSNSAGLCLYISVIETWTPAVEILVRSGVPTRETFGQFVLRASLINRQRESLVMPCSSIFPQISGVS